MNTFSHSGDCGDLIAALPTIKALGGGKLVLYPASHTGYRMTRERVESLRPLLEVQPYIIGVEWREHPVGTNLDHWRRCYNKTLNLADMCSAAFKVPFWPRDKPWLFVRKINRLAPVILHRSPRYWNWNFPWRKVWEKYHLDAMFVGHPEEHREFTLACGPIAYYRTKNFLELAEAIAGCDLYIGNQSSPFWVAEGLKANLVLEAASPQNCHWGRTGFNYGTNEHVGLPDDLEDSWAESAAGRAEDNTLLTTDRRKVLAKAARSTRRLPGDMAELGTCKGGISRMLASICPHKPMHLFDTFAGLPFNGQSHKKGEFAADEQDVRALMAGCNVRFHVGIFPETAAGLESLRFSLVHVDADLAASTKAAIDFFWPRMVPGGVMVFDDWRWESCPGVSKVIETCMPMKLIQETAPMQCLFRKPEYGEEVVVEPPRPAPAPPRKVRRLSAIVG